MSRDVEFKAIDRKKHLIVDRESFNKAHDALETGIELLEEAMSALIDAEFRCMDCWENIFDLGEYYMVRDEVWDSVVVGYDNERQLCIGCLEARLGRKLTPEDFKRCAVNDDPDFSRSPRLVSRLSGKEAA